MFTRHTADFATFVPAQNIATPAINTPAALANATLDVSAHSLFETPHGWVAAHMLRPGDEVIFESTTPDRFADQIDQVLASRAVYCCEHCGFSGRTLHWQCLSCKQWGCVVPVVGVLGE